MSGIALSDLSFVVTCMGRLGHLMQSAPLLAVLAPARTVVVDYACPERTGDWIETHLPAVDVVRVRDVRQFNLAAARNAGAAQVTSEWIAFVDADVLLAADFAHTLATLDDPRTYYVVAEAPISLRGTVLCPRAGYTAVGGYDEVMQGWGSEDTDFYRRLELAGWRQSMFPATHLKAIAHDDELRTRHYGGLDRLRSLRINAYYMYAKLDLMKLSGQALPLPARQALRARIAAQVDAALDAGHADTLELKLGQQPLSEDWEIRASLRYSLARRGRS